MKKTAVVRARVPRCGSRQASHDRVTAEPSKGTLGTTSISPPRSRKTGKITRPVLPASQPANDQDGGRKRDESYLRWDRPRPVSRWLILSPSAAEWLSLRPSFVSVSSTRRTQATAEFPLDFRFQLRYIRTSGCYANRFRTLREFRYSNEGDFLQPKLRRNATGNGDF